MNNLFRLVYCSRNSISAHREVADLEIAAILAKSRENNARDRVTGALLHSHGYFAQVLEGDPAILEQTFERIQQDLRHSDVVVLEARSVEKRLFGAWDMALAEAANPGKARETLGGALAEQNGDAGTTVVALLDGLVQRETGWAGVTA